MKKIILFLILIITLMAGCSGGNVAETSTPSAAKVEETTTQIVQKIPQPSSEIPIEKRTIKLPQSMIDEAIEMCKDKPMWGVNLAQIEVGYVKGAVIEAVIVLHNGNDAKRLVTLSYKPVYKTKESKMTGLSYEPAPVEASGWVTIDKVKMRLDELETLAVPIHLMVPDDYPGELPEHWEFDICASGITIREYQYTIEVTTKTKNETTDYGTQVFTSKGETKANLSLPNEYLSIISVTSNIGETPELLDYPSSRSILIGNLLENRDRIITITYTYDDTTLECHLPQPLLDGELSAIKAIVSTETGETPQAVNYNQVNGRLNIIGLLENKVRKLTIIYEYSEMIVIDYIQRWLITMI